VNNVFHTTCHAAIDECLKTKSYAVYYSSAADSSIEMHIHNCCEVFLHLSGGKQFYIGNQVYDMMPGDLFFINEFEAHKITHVCEGVFERFVLKFHPYWLRNHSDESTFLDDCFYNRQSEYSNQIHLSPDEVSLLVSLLDRLKSVEGYGQQILRNALALEIIVLLNRFCASGSRMDVTSTLAENHTTVHSIIQYINENLHQDLSLEKLSNDFFISKNHLIRIFKKHVGTTVHSYIQANRISLAKTLLSLGCSVSDACNQAGFNDYAHFIRTFSTMVGMSPKRYSIQEANPDY
jgi:AraC-like DNA-binding protein